MWICLCSSSLYECNPLTSTHALGLLSLRMLCCNCKCIRSHSRLIAIRFGPAISPCRVGRCICPSVWESSSLAGLEIPSYSLDWLIQVYAWQHIDWSTYSSMQANSLLQSCWLIDSVLMSIMGFKLASLTAATSGLGRGRRVEVALRTLDWNGNRNRKLMDKNWVN